MLLFRREERKGLSVCTRPPFFGWSMSAEWCCEHSVQTLVLCGPSRCNGTDVKCLNTWTSDVKARFSVTVPCDLAFSVLDEGIGWCQRCFSAWQYSVPLGGC